MSSSTRMRRYIITAAGITKIAAIVVGTAPAALSFILLDYYAHHARPDSSPHVTIDKDHRAIFEFAFLIVVNSALGLTIVNLLLYAACQGLSKNLWTKRCDCAYLAIGGTAQVVVGFIMLACAYTSVDVEPVVLKYAAAFLGILSGVVYWGAATLANQD